MHIAHDSRKIVPQAIHADKMDTTCQSSSSASCIYVLWALRTWCNCPLRVRCWYNTRALPNRRRMHKENKTVNFSNGSFTGEWFWNLAGTIVVNLQNSAVRRHIWSHYGTVLEEKFNSHWSPSTWRIVKTCLLRFKRRLGTANPETWSVCTFMWALEV